MITNDSFEPLISFYTIKYKLCSHFFNTTDGIGVDSHASKMVQRSSSNALWNACYSCRSLGLHLHCTLHFP